jgi:hypothetical protein
MIESFENAKEELKRIDHLIYVTLKYTRTVDVLLSVIERMINSYEFIIEAIIKIAKSKGEEVEELTNPIAKAQYVIKTTPSVVVKRNVKKYLRFRRIRKLEYESRNEFRRHVTMTVYLDEEKIEVNIDSVTNDFHELRKVMDYLQIEIKEAM